MKNKKIYVNAEMSICSEGIDCLLASYSYQQEGIGDEFDFSVWNEQD